MKQDADKKIASGLQGVVADATDWLDKATQCMFGRVCSSEYDSKSPTNTGGDQIAEQGPTNTGGNQLFDQYGNPTHTGNTENSDTSLSNTGNTDGAIDTGGNTTTTPIADQNKDDLAYLAGGYEPNKDAVGNMGEFFKQSGFGTDIKDNAQKSSQQYQGQSVYKATDDVGDYIRKGDQFYLDGQHKDHLEVFDKRGNFKAVLNLDGSINREKTQAATGRKLK
ncbi:hypothetical protein [[Enterobacter] lignolyticus]|uniref:hypothetical protein n=1 Tax=[Enterobacter] lignolyticus TaxID=1334193 RepID=UPI001EEFC54A|nr:hypothetical protein [[Enterobacter] lignolyticus]